MATILDEIVENKKREVADLKKRLSISELKEKPFFFRQTFSLQNVLKSSRTGIISEFKRKSPSKGDIHQGIEPKDVVPLYEKYGCSAVSCLADNKYFGGSFLDVVQARENLEHTPLLFKEFLTEPYQLYLAKASGADVVLLIAACLERSQCQELALEAKELGLETLLEIHSEDELSHYDESFVNVLGVNNRNLKIFKTDVQISRDIVKNLPENTVKVSESGISKPETVAELRRLGFNGFLMGENFMKESNPGIALKNFIDNVLTLL
ncbi:MAG: indole-3-glycerol phosphate synthase TrpC [Bacteroidales bacterium]|nr:indole-3-glycerol phosphate synthase TrpC [Bacteroidales bacterium]